MKAYSALGQVPPPTSPASIAALSYIGDEIQTSRHGIR
jgi:hypothetical protein